MMMPTSSVRHRRRCIAALATPVDRWTTNSNSFARFGVGITPSILQDGLAKKFIPFFGWREGLTSPHVVLGDPHRVPYIDKGRNSVTPSVMWWDSRIFFFGQIPRRQPGSLLTIWLQLPDMTRQYTMFGDGDNDIFGSQVGNWKFRYLYKAQFYPNFGHKFFRYPLFAVLYIWQSLQLRRFLVIFRKS